MKLTCWMADPRAPHCWMRCLEGADPNDIASRVAYIEKTPRVRTKPHTQENDHLNWTQGPKGSSAYGVDPASRRWCDDRLRELGYELPLTIESASINSPSM